MTIEGEGGAWRARRSWSRSEGLGLWIREEKVGVSKKVGVSRTFPVALVSGSGLVSALLGLLVGLMCCR